MAKDQTLTLFGDSDTPVPAIDPSGVIYVLHVRGTRTKEVEGLRLSPMWTAKRVPKKYSWSLGSFIEPAKPLFQVGYNQKVMFSRVSTSWTSFFWLTGTLTAVTSPDEMSRRHCDMCELRW